MTDWRGLYGTGWTGDIVPEAFAHPAKFSRALIRHIYAHAAEQRWLRESDAVVDPFGGEALGGLDAGLRGLRWTGCELEPKFVDLGRENIALWSRRFGGGAVRWVEPTLLQGDSRRLAEVVGPRFEACVTSGAFDAAVSSPPYASGDSAGPESLHRRTDATAKRLLSQRRWGGHDGGGQTSEGNLARARNAGFDAAVSSPPYEHPTGHPSIGSVTKDAWGTAGGDINARRGLDPSYGDNQRGGETFWSAARLIIEQTYAVLHPGARAIWVTKAFVRKGKRVDFPGQWRALCEAVGFWTVCEHRAWLVEHRGTQGGLFGGDTEHRTERKSFFRRLAESKGSPRIDWETVTCMERR